MKVKGTGKNLFYKTNILPFFFIFYNFIPSTPFTLHLYRKRKDRIVRIGNLIKKAGGGSGGGSNYVPPYYRGLI
jgi:hypothetical protein